jgi:TonB family protein
MALRCLLFSSDEGTAEPIRQVLAGLGVEGEYCSDAVAAVEKVKQQNYQIVIIDWDKQPEAGLLLTSARERKAAERPLTLAIVSDDASVPKALQAGANSILRKPLQGNQVKDVLATARDLLRAKQESATATRQAAAAAASAGSSATLTAGAGKRQAGPGQAGQNKAGQDKERPLRPGEFLHSSPSAPGAQFVIESGTHASLESSSIEAIHPRKDLEPVAASVTEAKPLEQKPAETSPGADKPTRPSPAPASVPPPDGPRGLEWYLKTRAGTHPTISAPPSAAVPPTTANPELLGFDQTPLLSSAATPPKPDHFVRKPVPEPQPNQPSIPEQGVHERKKEAELFAYMDGETAHSEEVPRPKVKLGKGAIMGAFLLAGCAILAAPQAPWHSQLRGFWAHGQRAMHGWLNPQPVTPAQAPVAHENFGRAGDEYKLPVEENIPDATTDPSHIQVVPAVDPTAKKPNNDTTNPEQPAGQADTTPNSPTPASAVPGQEKPQEKQPSSSPSEPALSASGPVAGGASGPTASVAPLRADSPVAVPGSLPSESVPAQPAPPKKRPAHEATPPGNVPSSLKSQLASMSPDGSGNRAPETAMDSIEPVAIAEAAERALLTDQPAIDYPANAKGQQGTVILQVWIGRDGTVQDAKFQQGSLAFARTAIDGVKQWKFKPYSMNGRPVSVQTVLTMSFKPAP